MLLKTTMRAYFKREKGMPYDERGKRVSSARNATSFVEAEITVGSGAYYGLRYGLRNPNTDDERIARDAFMSGRYQLAQEMLWRVDAPIRISVTGDEGYVTSPKFARAEARTSTRESLEDAVTDIGEWNQQWGTNFRSWDAATKHVLDTDGEYAGLDVHDTVYLGTRRAKPEKPGTVGRALGSIERVLITTGCGCIHDVLEDVFPELKPLIALHLSDMKAGAPDQERALVGFYKSPAWTASGRRSDDRDEWLAKCGILESQSDETIYVKGEGIRTARGYRYGSGWCAHLIPDDVCKQIHLMAEKAESEKAA